MSANVASLRWPRLSFRRRKPEPTPLSHAQEKRRLLGVLAFLVAIPFPMNEPQPDGVVSWPVVLGYLAVVSLFLWRNHLGRDASLPLWAMNLLGLAYIPWFLVRLRTLAPFHIARPMVEVLLFGLLVKLFSLRREKEKWHVAVLLFFLFVAAMATSVHPLIFVYLVAFLGLWMALLFRFLQYHLTSSYREGLPGSGERPMQPLLIACVLLTAVAATPFFALMPRLRTPYILGRGINPARPSYATGFRDEVDLDVVGNIRQNDAVAMRLKPEDATLPAPTLLRGTTYDRFEGNSWRRSRPHLEPLRPSATNLYRLSDVTSAGKIRVWLEPIESSSLILPVEAVSVELSERLYTDVGGGVLLSRPRQGLLEYRVGVASSVVYRADAPDTDAPDEGALDPSGITTRIRELGTRVAAGFPPPIAAQRIEQYLAQNYEYTLDFVGREAGNPIEDFLFRYRSGHCEYFATAMILMLRSVGIPARLVTGFMGAEFNPLEDYYIVRQNNAHAWVEAYLPTSGWTSFDPTPPAGRPASPTPSFATVMRQAWDYLEFRWDRYVMSYGFFDQIGLLLRMRDLWRRASGALERAVPDAEAPADAPGGILDGWRGLAPGGLLVRMAVPLALVLAAALALFGAIAWRRYRRLDATRAYRLLRGSLHRREPAIGVTTAPLAVQRFVETRFPQAAEPAGRLIRGYLLESYAGRGDLEDATSLRRCLREVRARLRARA